MRFAIAFRGDCRVKPDNDKFKILRREAQSIKYKKTGVLRVSLSRAGKGKGLRERENRASDEGVCPFP